LADRIPGVDLGKELLVLLDAWGYNSCILPRSDSFLDSGSTTGKVIINRKILGAEMMLISLSQIGFSFHAQSVGNRVEKITSGQGKTL